MWFHHPSQALPLTATVPRLPNGMERKAGRAYRSVLDLVVATCTAALVGAMSVVPPDPRRVAGVAPSVSRPCPDVICTGESRRRQRSDVRPSELISDLSGVESRLRRATKVHPQDAQRQLRPRRVDGRTPRHLLCAAVHSAGSQLPLEGTERDISRANAKWSQIKVL